MIFLSILLGYLLSDFALLPDELNKWKEDKIYGLFVHIALVLVINAVILFFVTDSWLIISLIVVVVHSLLDLIESKINLKRYRFPVILTEQVLNVTLASGFVYLAGFNLFSGKLFFMKILLLVNGLLLVTVFGAFLIKLVGEQSSVDKRYELGAKYRLISLGERGLLFSLIILQFYFLIPLIFLPRIFFEKIEIFTKYRVDFTIGLSLTVVVSLLVSQLV